MSAFGGIFPLETYAGHAYRAMFGTAREPFQMSESFSQFMATFAERKHDLEFVTEVNKKLIFYENLFFEVDIHAHGWIDDESAIDLIGFMCLRYDEPSLRVAMRIFNQRVKDDDKLVRWEFVAVCCFFCWNAAGNVPQANSSPTISSMT